MSDHPTLPFDAPERWLPVVGYEGLYEISDLGRVRSFHKYGSGRRGEFLATVLTKQGYPRVKLTKDRKPKRVLVHHLVTDAFLGPLPPGMVRRHKNGNKLDNRAANFCFGTHSDNVQDSLRHGSLHPAHGSSHCQAKLNEDKVREIRGVTGIRIADLARKYGVAYATMKDVVLRKTWKHVA